MKIHFVACNATTCRLWRADCLLRAQREGRHSILLKAAVRGESKNGKTAVRNRAVIISAVLQLSENLFGDFQDFKNLRCATGKT